METPANLKALHKEALRAIHLRQFVTAHKVLVQMAQLSPHYHDTYFLLGIVNSEVGQFNKAISLIEKAVELLADKDKVPSEYWVYLAKCESIVGDYARALNALQHCIDSDKLSPSHLDTLGVVLSRVGDHDKALNCFKRALLLLQTLSANKAGVLSENPQIYYNFAVSLKFSGNFKGAAEAFDKAIALNPSFYQALFARSDLKQKTNIQSRIQQLQIEWQKQDAHSQSDEVFLHLGHAMAIEYQQQKQYKEAFSILQQAKQKRCAQIDYSPKQDEPLFAAAQSARLQTASAVNTIQRPIFVVGMPRSGTTLMERIISGHSQVGSGGELQDFGIALKELTQSAGNLVLDANTLSLAQTVQGDALGLRYLNKTNIIAPNKARFIDKLPFNFFYLPLIHEALPGAKMICLLRDPMDTCLGNFRQLFSIQSPYYQYAYKLEWVGEFYAKFYHYIRRLENHLPNLKVVTYEALVAEPELHIREILAHCELDFEATCIAVENNMLPVSTASKVQVREPINTQSIGRWRNFEDELGPLKNVLRARGVLM